MANARAPVRPPNSINGDEVRRSFEQVSRKFDAAWTQIDANELAISSAVTQITVTTDAIDVRVGANETDITNLQADVATNTADLATNTSDISTLSGRVTSLEGFSYTNGISKSGSTITVDLSYVSSNLYSSEGLSSVSTAFSWTAQTVATNFTSQINAAIAHNMNTVVNGIHVNLNSLATLVNQMLTALQARNIL